jgi:F-type H+-transporting ATPase subunit delta
MAEYSTLARPYAKAAFEAALQLKQLDDWSTQLDTLAAITAEARVVELINNPSLPVQEKARIVKDLLGSDLADSLASLIDVLAENRRLTLLGEVSRQFDELKADHEKNAQAVVTSAFALTEAQQSALAKQLKAKLGRDVTLQVEVDASLIGGVLIRSGDLVIDGSVRGKLAKLAEAMNS